LRKVLRVTINLRAGSRAKAGRKKQSAAYPPSKRGSSFAREGAEGGRRSRKRKSMRWAARKQLGRRNWDGDVVAGTPVQKRKQRAGGPVTHQSEELFWRGAGPDQKGVRETSPSGVKKKAWSTHSQP